MNPFLVLFIPLLCLVVGYLFGEWKALGDYLRQEKMRNKTLDYLPEPPPLNKTDTIQWQDVHPEDK